MTTKIIFADLHVTLDHSVRKSNPLMRLRAMVSDVLSHHADAAAVIVLGDIAHRGDVASYRLAARALSRLPVSFYLLLEGFQHLIDAIDAVPGMMRYFLFGHLPATADGVWRGIPFNVLRSTTYQTFFTADSPAAGKYVLTKAVPHGIFPVDEEQVTFHHHSFWENIPVAGG